MWEEPERLPNLGRPESLWVATSPMDPRPTLMEDRIFDVVIVGAGIAGIATAFNLMDAGLSVAVVEADRILGGVTGSTTGKLTSQHGLRYHLISKRIGEQAATNYASANEWAVEWVARLVEDLRVDCDFVRETANVYTTDDTKVATFDQELAVCRKLGLPASRVVGEELPFPTAYVLRFKDQARFHPRRLLVALVAKAEEAGIEFFEGTRVTAVEPYETRTRILTQGGALLASHVVLATNYPIYDSAFFATKLHAHRAYAMAFELLGPIPEGMFISSDEPERSFRRQAYEGRDLLIVGGGVHKVGENVDTMEFFRELEKWTLATFGDGRALYRWSTQDNSTPDSMPYIGKCPGKGSLFVATGFDGWGMTTGIVAGRVIADLICGIPNGWADTFAPTRLGTAAIPQIVARAAGVAAEYVGAMLKPVEDYTELLSHGEAGIFQMETGKVALFRDYGGVLHSVSPNCTHMGCQVRWNSAEQSWDCPCHGSRFSPAGDVLHGPATKPLEQIGLSLAASANPESSEPS